MVVVAERKVLDAVEELVIGHFDGSLTEEQEKELAEALASSDSAKQLFLSYMRMEGRLHSLDIGPGQSNSG